MIYYILSQPTQSSHPTQLANMSDLQTSHLYEFVFTIEESHLVITSNIYLFEFVYNRFFSHIVNQEFTLPPSSTNPNPTKVKLSNIIKSSDNTEYNKEYLLSVLDDHLPVWYKLETNKFSLTIPVPKSFPVLAPGKILQIPNACNKDTCPVCHGNKSIVKSYTKIKKDVPREIHLDLDEYQYILGILMSEDTKFDFEKWMDENTSRSKFVDSMLEVNLPLYNRTLLLKTRKEDIPENVLKLGGLTIDDFSMDTECYGNMKRVDILDISARSDVTDSCMYICVNNGLHFIVDTEDGHLEPDLWDPIMDLKGFKITQMTPLDGLGYKGPLINNDLWWKIKSEHWGNISVNCHKKLGKYEREVRHGCYRVELRSLDNDLVMVIKDWKLKKLMKRFEDCEYEEGIIGTKSMTYGCFGRNICSCMECQECKLRFLSVVNFEKCEDTDESNAWLYDKLMEMK